MASVLGSGLCALCGQFGPVVADLDQAGVASAFAWATHFTSKHPGLKASSHLIVLPIESETSSS